MTVQGLSEPENWKIFKTVVMVVVGLGEAFVNVPVTLPVPVAGQVFVPAGSGNGIVTLIPATVIFAVDPVVEVTDTLQGAPAALVVMLLHALLPLNVALVTVATPDTNFRPKLALQGTFNPAYAAFVFPVNVAVPLLVQAEPVQT